MGDRMKEYDDWVNNPDNIPFEKLKLTRDGEPLTMKTELYEHLILSFYKEGHRHHNKLFDGLKEEVEEVTEAKTNEEIIDELGDVLWYVAVIANQKGATLEEVMLKNFNKLERRQLNGK
jgi:NTP pyrophosphatase (non-canonical NTP hydrolase)